MTVESIAATGRVQNAIARAAARTGVDFQYLLGQARIESGLRADARASTSSAAGLYQFIEQSWLAVVKKHGATHGLGWAADRIGQAAGGRMTVSDPASRRAILALRHDPEIASLMAAEHASDNADGLRGTLGRDAGGTDLYMAHFLGLGGARQFLSAMQASPGRSAAAMFPAAARANRNVFYERDGSPRSLAAVYQRFGDKLGRAAQAGGATATAEAGAVGGRSAAAPAGRAAALAARFAAQALTLDSDTTVVTGGNESAADALAWANAALGRRAGASGASALPAGAASPLRPTPETARLAYLMLAGMGG